MTKIVLTGTTGNLGSRTLPHLLSLVPPSDIIVSVFNPASSVHDEIRKKGVEIRQGDFYKPETLEKAFRGADKLFLVSVPSFEDELRTSAHRNAINAAKAAGVKHVYYTSLAIASTSTAAVMQAHLHTEALLKQSGLIYTIIREGTYTDTFPVFLGFFKNSDKEVVLPGNGGVAFVSWDDLAIANAKILASDEYKNKTVNLVGPQIVDMKQATAIVSSILGHEIKFTKVTMEEFLARHAEKVHAKQWSTAYPALEKGDWEINDPLLRQLVGKPLITFEQRAREILLAGEAAEAGKSELAKHHNYFD